MDHRLKRKPKLKKKNLWKETKENFCDFEFRNEFLNATPKA